jgi:hypothetical protein
MKDKTIAIYVFIDDILINIGHKEPINRKTTDAEIITTAIVSGLFYKGHIEHAISFIKSTGLLPNMLSKSRFNRRIHTIYELIISLFFHIAKAIKQLNITSEYSIDSFPIVACENIRIRRSKIIKGKIYRGFKASKRQYFYGFTVQVIATIDGIPVEFAILPGSIHDSEGMKYMFFDLPQGSTVYGDSAYTDYSFEDEIHEVENILLMITRKSNSKRKHEPWEEYLINTSRKGIETMFSQIIAMFPKRIHAVTVKGFLLKVILFIFAFTFQKALL